MPMMTVYITESDEKALIALSEILGRTPDELAEAAISDAICQAQPPRPAPKKD